MQSAVCSTDLTKAKSPKSRPHNPSMWYQARELQTLVSDDAKKEGIKPIERAALVRVWKELSELRLRLQGKGPPKAVDYSAKGKRGKAKADRGFLEAPIVASNTTTASVPSDKLSSTGHKTSE